MTARRTLWGITALLYILFFYWYTNTSGPLTDAEIEKYMARVMADNPPPEEQERMRTFMENDTGDDFVMANLVHLNPNPPVLPLTGENATPEDLMAAYMEYMFPAMLSRASHPVFAGPVVGGAMDILNMDGLDQWSQSAMVRYRSRRDLLEIGTNPEFANRHEYKLGALLKTVAVPVEPILYPSDPRILLALLLFSIASLIDMVLFRRYSQ